MARTSAPTDDRPGTIREFGCGARGAGGQLGECGPILYWPLCIGSGTPLAG